MTDAATQSQALDIQQEAAARARTSAEAQSAAQVISSYTTENQALREYIEAIGKTVSELEQLRLKRLDETIAKKEEAIAAVQLFDANAPRLDQLREELALLKEKRGLTAQGVAATNAQLTDPSTGASKAISEYQEKTRQKGKQVYDLMNDGLRGFEDNLTKTMTGGKAA